MLELLQNYGIGDEIFRQPGRLVPPQSWEGHIPFAYWLVQAIEPATLVELGAYTGNSYFAFCEALELTGGGRAYAVDTWQGDEHAGFYGDEVYQGVAAYNDQRFRSFSTLLRTTFDDARQYFPNGALGGATGGIDLLHIDGLHTYEAVRHDYDTWVSALSDRAVVVFHDINVREREFGVWRLWQELSERHPAIGFDHSFGLGAVAVGGTVPPRFRDLVESARDPAIGGRIRRVFASVGASLQRRLRLEEERVAAETTRERAVAAAREAAAAETAAAMAAPEPVVDPAIAEARSTIAWTGEALARADRLAAAKDVLLDQTDRALQDRDAILRTRDAEIRARDAVIEARTHELQTARDQHANSLRAERVRVDAVVADAVRRQAFLTEHAARVEDTYRASTSWMLTAPVRAVLRTVRRAPPELPIARTLPPDIQSPPVAPSLGNEPALPPLAPPPLPPADRLPAARDGLRAVRAMRLEAFLRGDQRIDLSAAAGPDRAPAVSVLLVLHNAAALALGCLSALVEARAAGGPAFEVVVLDNGSTDATDRLLSRIEGARIVRSSHNLHFLAGTNRAAREARGRHLLLLNSDAEVMPGAIAAAVALLDADSSIGAVGGRIVLADGTLQEAGSIIWRDGTCLGYGRGADPMHPDFMFRRDVDYCSGAFLMTPRATFERLGGLDSRYSPAYYEETDYCVRLHEDGLRVVFDPDVAILHVEFGSAGDREEAIALQRRNLGIFRARHAAFLARQPDRRSGAEREASLRRAPGTRRVLVIEDRLPKPELGSGYPRAERISAELVAAGAEVTFFPMFRHEETWNDARRVLAPGVRVMLHDAADTLRPFLETYRGAFDAILVCRPHNMRALLDAVGRDHALIDGVRVIYDAEAVFESRKLIELERAGRKVPEAEGRDRVAGEIALTRAADVITSVSAAELQAFQSHGARDVRLLGHTLDVAPSEAGFEDRDGFVFLGAVHDDNAPNADSLRWFARDVLPALRRLTGRPGLRLRVVGMNRAETVAALDGIDLDLVGLVDDPAVELERARVLVVPTRFAAGIPHKVHQAAACGIPIVSTALIASQLEWEVGRDLLASDDGSEFAEACARLHDDRALWETVRASALERVRAECDPARFRQAIRGLLADIPPATPFVPSGVTTIVPAESEDDRYAGRRVEDDWAVAVPFAYPAPIGAAPGPIAVFCHLFHDDLAEEIRAPLGNIPFPADLFLSTDTDAKRDGLARVFAGWEGGTVDIRVVPNRGRDIAPKLLGLREIRDRYPYVLCVHAKKSLHAPFLAPWRNFLFETLLGSPAVVRSVFEAFAHLPRLGMVVPQHFDPVRRWVSWNGNFVEASRLAARMGFALSPETALDFPSGSMFWARTDALRPLLDLDLGFDDFPVEGLQTDQTVTHAIERLFLHACEQSGHDWIKIADPLLHMQTGRIARIGAPASLLQFQAEHGVRLLGPDAPACGSEVPPMMTRIAPGLARRLPGRAPTP